MKKLLAGLLSLVMTATVVATPLGESISTKLANTSISAKAETVTNFNYDDPDIFVADAILGLAKIDGNKISPFGNLGMVVSQTDWTYKQLAEGLIDDEWRLGSAIFWQNTSKALKFDIAGIANWQQVMYEELLMDYLTYSCQTEEFKSNFVDQSMKFAKELTDKLVEPMEGKDLREALKSMSIPEAEKFLKTNGYYKKLSDYNTVLNGITDGITTCSDYIKRVSTALAMADVNQSRIDFLKKMQEVTSDYDLYRAIDKIIEYTEKSKASITFSKMGYEMCEQILENGWSIACIAIGGSLGQTMAAINLGKAGLNWMFNSDDLSSSMMQLTIIHIIASYSNIARNELATDYMLDKTHENAYKMNNGFLMNLNMIGYASNIAEKYIGEKLINGAFNQLVTLFPNNKNEINYNWLKGCLDSDIKQCVNYSNLVGRWYNLYTNIKGNIDDWYYDNDIHVTGVKFKRKEAEYGTKDSEFFFDEKAVVTPTNATDKRITYSSSDESVIKVHNISGRMSVDFGNPGTATITAKTVDGGYTDTMKITIVDGHGKDGTPYVNDIEETQSKPLSKGSEFTIGKLTYEVTNNGEVEVDDCSSSAISINIPKYVAYKGYNYKVISIGDKAFYHCTSLASVTIPNSVTNIGYRAFSDCTNLTSITVDSNNKKYSSQDGVLFNKDKTELIKYPGRNTRTSYNIPNSVTSIGDSAFYNCESLTSVTIPNSVTIIVFETFAFCEKLTNVTIPNSVTSIEDDAFYFCESLTSVTIPNSVTNIGYNAFGICSNLNSVTIGNSVTSIGNTAFYHCTSLASVTIPNSVTNIGYRAFSDCTNLTSITVDSNNKKYSSQDGVLFNKDKTELIKYPGRNTRTSYNIPNSVTSIGDSAFYNCESLTSVTIPNSVTIIVFETFAFCEKLTNVTIPNSVTSIEDDAFYFCESLTSVTIPNSVTNIGYDAFDYSSLKDVYYGGAKEEWDKINISYSNYSLKHATIHYNYKPHTHSYTSSVTKQPTCKATGIRTYICSCGDSYTETIQMTAHSYKNVTVNSTYFTKGYTGKKCSVCGTVTGKKYKALLTMATPKASSNTTSSIKLTWSKVKDAKCYDVYQLKGNKWSKIKTVTGTSYTVPKLKSGTSYKFYVKPYTKSGSKNVYGNASKALTTSTKSSAVSLKVTAGKKKASLSWKKVTGATNYAVYYKTSAKGKWIKLKTANNKITSYTKTKLTSKKTYWFKVDTVRKANGKTYTTAGSTKSVKIK